MVDEHILLVEEWRKARASGQSRPEFCAHRGVTIGKLKWAQEKYALRAAMLEGASDAVHYKIEQKPWHLHGDWLVIGDVHVPTTDWGLAGMVAKVAEKYLHPPRRLLVAGDFFNMDNFSHWAQVIAAPTWAQEREAARLLISEWLKAFEQIRFLTGNHERRLQKFTAGALEETDIIKMVTSSDRVSMNVYGWCEITSGGETYRVTHPRNYSINRLSVVDTLAQKFGQHIIGFHEHHLAKGWSRFGQHVIINGGCLVEPSKLAYVSLDDSKSAAMVKGFVLLRNGVAHLFGEPPYTDWSAVIE